MEIRCRYESRGNARLYSRNICRGSCQRRASSKDIRRNVDIKRFCILDQYAPKAKKAKIVFIIYYVYKIKNKLFRKNFKKLFTNRKLYDKITCNIRKTRFSDNKASILAYHPP